MSKGRWLGMALLVAGAAHADEKPAAEPARYAARAWMGALRDKLPDRMAKLTAFPFSADGMGPRTGKDAKRCATQSAKDAKGFDAAAKCMLGATELMGDLPADFSLARWKVLDAGEVPAAFEKKKDKLAALAKDHALVQLELTGDALNYTLVFAVRAVAGSNLVAAVFADGKKAE